MDVSELKRIQKKVIKKSRIINFILVVIWGLSIYAISRLKNIDFILFFSDTILIIVIGAIIRFLILNKQIIKFNNGFKNVFVFSALNKIFDNLNYFPDKGLEKSIIEDTKMMNMGDKYSSNDYFEAEYKNVKVKQADVHIEEEHKTTDSDGNQTTEWTTIFRGKWMIFNFNKKFNANIQVCQNGFRNSTISNWGETQKYQKIKMEDELFNKMFTVYAQDMHDAFYILTPSLMEKIKKLSNDIDGEILLCFINNELHVGLYNNEDSFEHSVYKKINEEKINNEISRDIKVITNFVDQLNLDNNLFRKEG